MEEDGGILRSSSFQSDFEFPTFRGQQFPDSQSNEVVPYGGLERNHTVRPRPYNTTGIKNIKLGLGESAK
jgi:hypothetical protein